MRVRSATPARERQLHRPSWGGRLSGRGSERKRRLAEEPATGVILDQRNMLALGTYQGVRFVTAGEVLRDAAVWMS